jgi:hypothetical protein
MKPDVAQTSTALVIPSNLPMENKLELSRAFLQSNFVKGYDNEFDVLQAVEIANYMHLPIPYVLANAFPINGKLAYNTRMKKALAVGKGLRLEVICNYKPLRRFVNPDREDIIVLEETILGNSLYVIYNNLLEYELDETKHKDKIKLVIVPEEFGPIYDYITQIKGSIDIIDSTGKVHTVEGVGEFRYSEAATAELISKDNWRKYPKDCIFARALNRLVELLAPHALTLPLVEELASEEDVTLAYEDIAG